MKTIVKAMHPNRILVQPMNIVDEDNMIGGVVIPTSAKQLPTVKGKVVQIGSNVKLVKVGDEITYNVAMFQGFSGISIIDDVEYLIMEEAQIYLILWPESNIIEVAK